jgi:S-DNA-T family DNA segregation ATPase FtsK/SpoIIIE
MVATKPSPRSSRPRSSSSSGRPPSGFRATISGHEEDLVGLLLIAGGVVLALSIYGNFAGIVGRGLNWLTTMFTGLGRYLVPIVLAAIGIGLIRNHRSEHRYRMAIGYGMTALAVVGLLHVLRGPHDISGTYDDVQDAGGWVGAIVGEPIRGLLATAGADALLIAAAIAGVVLATGLSLRTVASKTASGARRAGVAMAAALRPALGMARRKFDEVSTLTSERLGMEGEDDAGKSGDLAPPAADPATDETRPLPPPVPPRIYDVATEPPDRRRRSRPTLPPPVAPGDADDAPASGEWRLPPPSVLERTGTQQIDRQSIEARGHDLEAALASHSVETRLVGMTVGPTVTRYELELGPGVKVARVTALHKDIAYALAAIDVRILAPIPGRSAIGVEVPNNRRQLVALGDLLASPEAAAATHPLEVAIGKDIAGRAVMMNLATTPHLLIAGATGAGKSSALNCIITSILMRSTPDQVRLILVDPKQVEMGQYNRLPHLLTQPVTNPKKAANALAWAVREMERRYDLLAEVGFRDVGGYNSAIDRGDLHPEPGGDGTYERLPFVVVVVDELNDLMMVAARDVEDSITRIAQKARAVGIHLIIATQRPSVNVITGVIKANIPARIAFAVSSLTDSRVILDQPGAERLVGKGDMLVLGASSNVAQRVQGAWVSEEEVRLVVAFWRRQAPEVSYVSGIEGDDGRPGGASAAANGEEADDEALVRQAMELVVRSQLGSTSMLQRKLKIGFARAGRIMDLLEQRGVVGPSEGSKARAVLMTPEEFDGILASEAED